jgi:hypothetical protein
VLATRSKQENCPFHSGLAATGRDYRRGSEKPVTQLTNLSDMKHKRADSVVLSY